MKLECSRQILKSRQISNVMKIRPVEVEMLQVDGHKDRRTESKHDEADRLFLKFCERT
jgi:hypothetical protein